MMNGLKIEDVDGVKLVQDENFAPDDEVRTALEGAFMQGSQGWGVTGDVGIVLTLAAHLHATLRLANEADEAQRLLKGLQMSNGKIKKLADALKVDNDALAEANKLLSVAIEKREAKIGEQASVIADLQRALLDIPEDNG